MTVEYEIVRISIRDEGEFELATGRFIVWEKFEGRSIEVLDFELKAPVPDGGSFGEAEAALKRRFAEFADKLSKAGSA